MLPEEKRLAIKRFLDQFSPDGEFRGPMPPKKSQVIPLDEPGGEEWHESWVDKTGDWEYWDKGTKGTVCECGNKVWWMHASRAIRCDECNRVLVDRQWEDTRYENPNIKEEGCGEGDSGGGLERWM